MELFKTYISYYTTQRILALAFYIPRICAAPDLCIQNILQNMKTLKVHLTSKTNRCNL